MTQQASIITTCARKFVCAAGHAKPPRRLLDFCTAVCMLPDGSCVKRNVQDGVRPREAAQTSVSCGVRRHIASSASSTCAHGVVCVGRQGARQTTVLLFCRLREMQFSFAMHTGLQGATVQPSSRLWRFQSSLLCCAQQ
jgi:hypothetical protein